MKKITAISLIVLISFQSCKKSGVEALVEDDYISGIIKDSVSWVYNAPTPDSLLGTFRAFSSADDILETEIFGSPGIQGDSYEIPNFTPVDKLGQHRKGSCGAWSVAYTSLSYYFAKKLKLPYSSTTLLSPDFVHNSLINLGKTTCNNGTFMHDIRDFIMTNGVCNINFLPLEKNKESEVCLKLTTITQAHKNNAKSFMVSDILRYDGIGNQSISTNINDFKKIIDKDIPIIIIIATDDGFKDMKKNNIFKSHIGNWSGGDDKKSYHWLVLKGYDNTKNAFKCQNSWGTGWKENGSSWIDYDFLFTDLIKEAYVLKIGKANVTEQTGVTFYNNYHEAVCIGGGPNTGVFGGNMSGVNVLNWSGLNIARFTQQNHSRIEYNLNNTIPGYPDQINPEGTFEMTANIQSAYLYNNYQLENDSIATLFTTDNSGADVNWPGSMRLLASKTGTIQFIINTQKYGNAPNILEAKNTHFKFKQWHRIGVSYGSQGMHIMLDGEIVASNINFKQKIANGGGHSLQNDRPTIGEAKSYFPWGNYQYGRGFEGYLYKVRSSAIQSDFKLSL